MLQQEGAGAVGVLCFSGAKTGLAEESSAAWLDDDHVLLAASLEPEDPTDAAEADAESGSAPRLRPGGLAICVAEDAVPRLLAELAARGVETRAIIGRIVASATPSIAAL